MQSDLFGSDLLKPLDKYPGKKAASGTWQRIISEIPKCELFIEAMCGSAFISSQVKASHIIFNDIDEHVIRELQLMQNIDRSVYSASNMNYRDLVKLYDNGNRGRVFYFDPPYLFSERRSKRNLYRFEWQEKDHLQFLGIVKKMECPVMISHYPCKLYNKELKTWRKITYKSMTRGGVMDECLYMNFDQPVLLQHYESVGINFTDRQRIKRKVQRLIDRLENEGPQERAAILSAIIHHYEYVKE